MTANLGIYRIVARWSGAATVNMTFGKMFLIITEILK